MKHHTERCTLTLKSGRECLLPVPDDAPMFLCMKHLQEAWLYISDQIRARTQHNAAIYQAAANARVAARSVVYYVRIRDHVKIGTTINFRERMSSLDPDEVLATEPGGAELERQRHKQFAHLRARRKEYFQPGPDLLAHIERLKQAA